MQVIMYLSGLTLWLSFSLLSPGLVSAKDTEIVQVINPSTDRLEKAVKGEVVFAFDQGTKLSEAKGLIEQAGLARIVSAARLPVFKAEVIDRTENDCHRSNRIIASGCQCPNWFDDVHK